MKHPWVGDGLAHMVETADPRDDTLDTHSESAVGNAAVPPQVEIPIERLSGQLVRRDALEQRVVVIKPLSPSDDLTVAFRSKHIDRQRKIRSFGIRFHVKGLYGGRKAVHHNRMSEMFSQSRLVWTAEITTPFEWDPALLQDLNGLVVRHSRERRLHGLERRGVALEGVKLMPAALQDSSYDRCDEVLA